MQATCSLNALNRKWGKDTVRFAMADPKGYWKTRFENRSSRYAIHLAEVLTVP